MGCHILKVQGWGIEPVSPAYKLYETGLEGLCKLHPCVYRIIILLFRNPKEKQFKQ